MCDTEGEGEQCRAVPTRRLGKHGCVTHRRRGEGSVASLGTSDPNERLLCRSTTVDENGVVVLELGGHGDKKLEARALAGIGSLAPAMTGEGKKLHPLLKKICVIMVSSMWQSYLIWFMSSSFCRNIQHLIQYVLLKMTCEGVEARALLKITSLQQSKIAQHKKTAPTYILYLSFKSTP
jgi:uncharacterized membrane protein